MEANTKSLEENRQLAIAESYQARTQMLHESWLRQADSDELAHISTKFRAGGATALTPEEEHRLRALSQATLTRLDNVHFQHQLGYLTDEFYESTFKQVVRFMTPQWKELEVASRRPSFRAEVDRIVTEAEAQS